MTTETGKSDIVNDYRAARARLRLGPYERYLAEWLAARVADLMGKRDAEDRGGDDQGDVCKRREGGRTDEIIPRASARPRARGLQNGPQ